MKTAGFGAPSVCDVFERDKVGSCSDGAYALSRVSTRKVSLKDDELVKYVKHEPFNSDLCVCLGYF